MKKIAIIPARSGSKGLKDKNIKNMCGKPLMFFTINAAIESGIFDCVHVSTESEKYASIARSYGADVSFLRDKIYATDEASTWDTVKYVLGEYAKRGHTFDVVTVLQPTSPLRTSIDIINAYKLFNEKKANSIISVCEMEHSPLLCNTLAKDLSLDGFVDMSNLGRRQDIQKYYRINGAIYMLKIEVLANLNDLYGNKSYAYVMSNENSIDIDSEIDFKLAELSLSMLERR